MRAIWSLGLCLIASATMAAEPTAATPSATEKFDGAERPKNWTVNFGHWEPENGVLVARQLDKDNHAAASRWQIPLSDGVVKLKLRFAGAKGFHIGFDPAPGQLDKQGHLYSLVLTPSQAQLKKHKDKAQPESKDVTLATAGFTAQDRQWLNVELRTTGDRVQAIIVGATGGVTAKLEATDPSFRVAKPAIVFRAMGGDVQIDDVEVTVTKPGVSARQAAKR
jgi:hypothetical protein